MPKGLGAGVRRGCWPPQAEVKSLRKGWAHGQLSQVL